MKIFDRGCLVRHTKQVLNGLQWMEHNGYKGKTDGEIDNLVGKQHRTWCKFKASRNWFLDSDESEHYFKESIKANEYYDMICELYNNLGLIVDFF